jgi:hypothetical protein
MPGNPIEKAWQYMERNVIIRFPSTISKMDASKDKEANLVDAYLSPLTILNYGIEDVLG